VLFYGHVADFNIDIDVKELAVADVSKGSLAKMH
jgi:hypothetical protein